MNALQRPACLHLCITLRTVGKVPVFAADLKDCVAQTLASTILLKGSKPVKDDTSTAAVYGMAGSLPAGPLKAILTTYADVVLKA